MKAPFKMKYSPVKGRLGDFFKKATPETKAKRAEAKKTRKAGESQYQADVRTKREANRASKKAVAAKPTKNATKNATKNKPTDNEIKVDTKNNLTLGSGSTPKMGGAGDVNKKGTGKYKDNTYTRSGKTGSTSVVTKGGKRTKVTGDIKDYTKKGGNTKIKVKAKNKGGGYSNATSVNAMVVQRDKFRADPKNKGKKYPGQAEINKRLKKNPGKFD